MKTTDSNLRAIIALVVAAINGTKKFAPLPPEPLIGDENVTSLSKPPRLVWVPLEDDEYRQPHEQPDDATAYYETTTICELHVWGNDLAEAECLRNAVLITGHVLYSPNAFIPSGKGKYSKGTSSGERGVEIVMNVGFVVPIIYEEFSTALAESMAAGTDLIVNTLFPDADVPTTTVPDLGADPGTNTPSPGSGVEPTTPTVVAEAGGFFVDDSLGEDSELFPDP